MSFLKTLVSYLFGLTHYSVILYFSLVSISLIRIAKAKLVKILNSRGSGSKYNVIV